ncbi:MAG: 50S ribosomal protein L30 [Gammaproteobacteria bacterium]|nr:50S ribosomal protein L30 [Gammaproteobacteria bacterium]
MTKKNKKLRVTLVKSTNKKLKSHKACVIGLGLRRIGHVVEVENTPEIRGMINTVGYLLEVQEI